MNLFFIISLLLCILHVSYCVDLCHCHSNSEFTCKNGSCIPIEWMCDNVPDCLDGEDETYCDYLHKCPKEFFLCRSSECLPKKIKCDGQADCFDGSDEVGCKKKILLSSFSFLPCAKSNVNQNFAFWNYVYIILALLLTNLCF